MSNAFNQIVLQHAARELITAWYRMSAAIKGSAPRNEYGAPQFDTPEYWWEMIDWQSAGEVLDIARLVAGNYIPPQEREPNNDA